MLVDPDDNRLVGQDIRRPNKRVNAGRGVRSVPGGLLPCQRLESLVFRHAQVLRSGGEPGGVYSFTGALERPLQVLDGGYITWIDPRNSGLYQLAGGADQPAMLADITSLARTSAPLRTVSTRPGDAVSERRSHQDCGVGNRAARSRRAVRTAAQATALTTAEAFLSLAAEAESWE